MKSAPKPPPSMSIARTGLLGSALVNLDMLIEQLGGDHGAMHYDLVGKFACSAYREAGRDERPVYFTIIPNYERDRQRRNARWEEPRSG